MISKLLTKYQENKIIEIIKTQCMRYQAFESQYDDLFYEPYTQMRHKHTATSAIISGFAPGRFQIEGISSTDLNYGLNDRLVQPELSCKNGIFHIYSDGSDLKGNRIIKNCKRLNNDIETYPLFFMIIVTVSKYGQLHKIEIYLPDKNGKIILKKPLYQSSK